MIAEGVLAIEMGATAMDLELTIHPHPTLGNHHGGRRGLLRHQHGYVSAKTVARLDLSGGSGAVYAPRTSRCRSQ